MPNNVRASIASDSAAVNGPCSGRQAGRAVKQTAALQAAPAYLRGALRGGDRRALCRPTGGAPTDWRGVGIACRSGIRQQHPSAQPCGFWRPGIAKSGRISATYAVSVAGGTASQPRPEGLEARAYWDSLTPEQEAWALRKMGFHRMGDPSPPRRSALTGSARRRRRGAGGLLTGAAGPRGLLPPSSCRHPPPAAARR
jgi:hypothetical protein